jgi:hypothetical protein
LDDGVERGTGPVGGGGGDEVGALLEAPAVEGEEAEPAAESTAFLDARVGEQGGEHRTGGTLRPIEI